MTGFVILYAVAAAALLFHHAAYPLLVALLARLVRRPPPPRPADVPPRVSLVLATHNEREELERNLASFARLPRERAPVEFLIGSDGSSDGTPEALEAARAADARIVPLLFPTRRGKVAVLNDLVPRATGEILVLTDTDTTFDHAALAALLAPLADPEIGAVTGRRRIGVPAPEQGGEGAYLAFESWLCARESAIHSTVGAWGSFYAVRRELFPRLPAGNLHDDQCAVLSVLLAGRRVVHVPAAVAWENAEAGLAQEFRRKVRFAARGFQTVAARPGILNPAAGFPFVAMLSHKILRWLAPLFWAALLVAAVALRRHGALFEATAWAFAAGAAAAALGGILERTGGPRVRLLRYAFFAAAMNAAFLWGTVRFLLGRESAKWDPSTGRMR